jgi:hypothetical protein
VWERNDFTTGGPIVKLGTKWPSMTSMCNQSASALTSPTASAKPPKSADSKDGATRSIDCEPNEAGFARPPFDPRVTSRP